jgi:lipid II:glycine glycyltransferase (peptidoglycan interpeptide bridge formation enzyme)
MLQASYKVEVNKVQLDEWSQLIQRFDDASLYQTDAYGAHFLGGKQLEFVVLKESGVMVAAAMVRVKLLPLLNKGIAYLYWGPLWRLRGSHQRKSHLCQMLKALFEEYVAKRKLLLRIVPNLWDQQADEFLKLFSEAGFKYMKPGDDLRTITVDLTPSMDRLRKNLRANWRNHLKRAEKNGLKIIQGSKDCLFAIFQNIYEEMLRRKKFSDHQDIPKFRSIQKALPDALKMEIMVCKHNDTPISATICSAIGDTATYLLGATNRMGMKLKGSYLLQWRTIEWLKSRGCLWYDLGGINPETNPGVYHFKAGLKGDDMHYLGRFEACQNSISAVSVKLGECFYGIQNKVQ